MVPVALSVPPTATASGDSVSVTIESPSAVTDPLVPTHLDRVPTLPVPVTLPEVAVTHTLAPFKYVLAFRVPVAPS